MINIAILGYGTVGSGVYEVIRTNQEIVNKKAGEEICVKYVLDLREFEGDPVQEVLVHDYNLILNDPEVKIVAEVMGGLEPAHTFVRQALESGKHVCTSNKELVAKFGAELLQVAKEHQVNFFYEASVGGGIPIIRPLLTSLTCDDITEISGILNGTTNYILSQMCDHGLSFDVALKQAQDKGYAERNPEADVEGYDACRKIAILGSLLAGQQVNYEDIHTEGITKITEEDFLYAKTLNGAIKLVATVQKIGGKLYSMVSPMIIPEGHPLYPVNDVFNAVFVHGNMLDDAMFYGRGAGKLPTASAVVADVVDAAKNIQRNLMQIWEPEALQLGEFDDWRHTFLVRVEVKENQEFDEEAIEAAFGDVIYITPFGVDEERAFLTKPLKESKLKDALSKVDHVISVLRVAK